MGRYRKIQVSIHNDAKFRSLSDKAKLLWFTMFTFPDLTSIGCMRFTEAGMAENMGWPLKDFQKAFQEVLLKGLIQYDRKAKFLCFPKFIIYNQPENPNVVKSWSKIEGLLPECSLKDEYIQSVKDFIKDIGKGFLEAFPKGLSKGIGKQEQEQEQNNIPPLTPPRGNGVVPFQKIQESWNLNAPPLLPRVKVLDEKRRKLIKAVWSEHPEVPWFDEFFRDVNLSDHHSGRNDRGWTPDIFWVLKERVRLQEKFESLKQGGGAGSQAKIRHGPDCPRCRGAGIYKSSDGPDGQPIMKECDYKMVQGGVDEGTAPVAPT